MHSYKYSATLQYNAAHGSGIQLLKIIKDMGHETGIGIATESVIFTSHFEACLLIFL